MKRAYLDNAATTPVDPKVLEAMMPFFSENFGNASSIHDFGQQALKAVDQSRETVANFLGCEPKEIFFTSGATEANNAILFSLLEKTRTRSLITTGVEHPSVYEPAKKLKQMGVDVRTIQPDSNGFIDPVSIAESIDTHTGLISVIHVQNEIGTIQPIKIIGKLIREKEKQVGHRIHFHADMVQALGKIKIDLKELDVDSASFSGHKFCGPKGTGILFMRNPSPLLFRGGEQEFGVRTRTKNVPAINGISKVVEK